MICFLRITAIGTGIVQANGFPTGRTTSHYAKLSVTGQDQRGKESFGLFPCMKNLKKLSSTSATQGRGQGYSIMLLYIS
jgi:hypothetical protein